jgi:hypothetical protein
MTSSAASDTDSARNTTSGWSPSDPAQHLHPAAVRACARRAAPPGDGSTPDAGDRLGDRTVPRFTTTHLDRRPPTASSVRAPRSGTVRGRRRGKPVTGFLAPAALLQLTVVTPRRLLEVRHLTPRAAAASPVAPRCRRRAWCAASRRPVPVHPAPASESANPWRSAGTSSGSNPYPAIAARTPPPAPAPPRRTR